MKRWNQKEDQWSTINRAKIREGGLGRARRKLANLVNRRRITTGAGGGCNYLSRSAIGGMHQASHKSTNCQRRP